MRSLFIVQAVTILGAVPVLAAAPAHAPQSNPPSSPPAEKAAAGKKAPEHFLDKRVVLGFDAWFSTGKGNWKTSFLGSSPDVGLLEGTSELDWDSLDAIVYSIYGDVGITPWLFVGGHWGTGSVDNGVNTDTDTGRLPLIDDETVIVSESKQDSDGDTTFYEIHGRLRFTALGVFDKLPGQWDLLFGYEYYTDDLRLRNGRLTTLFDEPFDEPFSGLDSTYQFEWSGYQLGLQGVTPLGKRFAIEARLVYLFAVDYQGEGFWNLREDLSPTPPSFTHDANGGSGADLRAALVFFPHQRLSLRVGYWYTRWEADNGTDTSFFADGTSETINLDSVETTRQGLYVGVAAQL